MLCSGPQQLSQETGADAASTGRAGETQADARQEGGQTVSPKQEQAVVAGEKQMGCPWNLLLKCLQRSLLVHESDSSSHGCRPSCRRAIIAPVE